jgi:hypothetical protein
MVMVEYSANTPARSLGDFACALGGANADVLTGNGCTLADIASGVEWVKGDKVARTFANPLGRRSSALGGSFADVSRALTDVAAGAALAVLRLGGWLLGGGGLLGGGLLGGWLRCVGRLRRGLGLAVLTGGILAAEDKHECEEPDGWFWECGSHGLNLPSL